MIPDTAWLLFVSTTKATVTSVAILGLALSTLVAIVRPHRTAARLAMVGVALGISWILAWLADRADFHDADGWADCWPSCNAVQTATGVTLIYGALATGAVGVISFAMLVRARRGTR